MSLLFLTILFLITLSDVLSPLLHGPFLQGVTTLGTIYSSSLFPGRCPNGEMLLLNYIGGASNRSVLDVSNCTGKQMHALLQVLYSDVMAARGLAAHTNGSVSVVLASNGTHDVVCGTVSSASSVCIENLAQYCTSAAG